MRFDYVLVGGGLQNALIAMALLDRRPRARVAMVEHGARLGGNHVWAFHADDVPDRARSFVDPLVVQRWPRYHVAFLDGERTLEAPYAAVSAERLHQRVSARLRDAEGCALLLRSTARSVLGHEVYLEDGRRLEAELVVDARGPEGLAHQGPAAFQKFVGLELSVRRSREPRMPTLIDATVQQHDGFRFVYTLPLDDERVLVEDTYFSDTPDLDVAALRTRVLEHAALSGLEVQGIVREERGVLPLPLEHMPVPSGERPLVAGYRGGWFHPTTGYSFPLAVRIAQHVADSEPSALFGDAWDALVSDHEHQARFGMLLNRWLFRAMPIDERWRVLSRFYRLPEATIRRFYAMSTTRFDRARIVCGRPPKGISLRSALAEVSP